MMVEVVGKMSTIFCPRIRTGVAASLANAASRQGVQWLSLVMILIRVRESFCRYEVALNRRGRDKSRNYLLNHWSRLGLQS